MTPEQLGIPSPVLAGRYRVGSLLGSGGMARVYHARDLRLSRSVAVKIFKAGADGVDETSRHRFQEEARLLANLEHANLVTVYDVGSDQGQPFLVMRLVKGPTLRALLKGGPLPAEKVCDIGAQLASTLAYVHSRAVLHRDVKPSNVLLGENGRPFLTDFGLARIVGAASLTRSGEMVGTAAYLAPEQVRGTLVGPPGDVYSLGLVLLECLTGEMEYVGTEAEAAVARLSRSPRVPAEVPRPLDDVLTAMTMLDPENRPSAATCADWLRRLADGGLDTAASHWPTPDGPAFFEPVPNLAEGEYATPPFAEASRPSPVAEESLPRSERLSGERLSGEHLAGPGTPDSAAPTGENRDKDTPGNAAESGTSESRGDQEPTAPLTARHPRRARRVWFAVGAGTGIAAAAAGLTLAIASYRTPPQNPASGSTPATGGVTTVIVQQPPVGPGSPTEAANRMTERDPATTDRRGAPASSELPVESGTGAANSTSGAVTSSSGQGTDESGAGIGNNGNGNGNGNGRKSKTKVPPPFASD